MNENIVKWNTSLSPKLDFYFSKFHLYANKTYCIDPFWYFQFDWCCSPVDNPYNSVVRNQVCMCPENILYSRLLLPLTAICQGYIPGPLCTDELRVI